MPRKLIATQYISLDGVIEDPVGMEESGLGDWTGPFKRGPEGDGFKHAELMSCDALVFGRRTYEGFAAVWPHVQDEAGFADRMNKLPKHIASRTMTTASWANSMILSEDAVSDIRRLRAADGGDILVYGSATLLHDLLAQDLVDRVNLMIYPVTLGRGKRLWAEGSAARFALIDVRVLGSGILLVRYDRDRAE